MTHDIVSSIAEFWRGHTTVAGIAGITLVVIATSYVFGEKKTATNLPPRLSETMPFFTNSFQLITDRGGLCSRARETMQKFHSEVLHTRLLGRSTYLIQGGHNTQTLFQPNSGLTAGQAFDKITKVLFGPTDEDFKRFVADKSGRLRTPAPGFENMPEKDRLWYGWHHLYAQYLTQTKATSDLAARFFDNFADRVTSLYEKDEWNEILVTDFMYRHQLESAGFALSGTGIFEKNPDYLERFLGYELSIVPCTFGPPRWMNPKPHRDRDRFLSMCKDYVTPALKTFDWSSPEADAEWEPVFGALFTRKLIRWGLDVGLDKTTVAGMYGIQVMSQNSNTVPASAWALMESLSLPGVWAHLQEEAEAALMVDTTTGRHQFDMQKLLASPWLQAVYTETLRRHSVYFITRDVTRNIEIDGYTIPPGSMVQAPMLIAHYNNSVWDAEGHSADEFWPQRHLKNVGEKGGKVEFALGNRSAYWFPYGGGPTMCPGRHFARQEIIMTIALFASRFDVEVVGWTMRDGSPSDHGPKNGDGIVIAHPDRDMKIRVKRRW